MSSMPSDLEIARAARLRQVDEIAEEAGIRKDELVPFGDTKAKIKAERIIERLKDRPDGYYIDVTAVTPTPLGEGKTTTTIGLTQALGRLGKKVAACIRQPSMGPTFNIKGGAAGGGYAQVVPMEDFNLHLTGDIHAVGTAHNLIAAAIDARMYHESRLSDRALQKRNLRRLDIDPYTITWNRVVDICDRSLRHVIIGLGEKTDGIPRQSGFDITVASELMAILALATSLKDLRERIGRVVIGYSRRKEPVTVEDLGAAGAATVLMKDALMPTLLQTLEGQAAFVHAGPFANIAHGNSSVIADMVALKLFDYVVTESGFGADMGMEKFFDIKCRVSGKVPHAVVLVATVRALKMHGGGPKVVPGKPLHEAYTGEDVALVEKGCSNLVANIQIARKFGVPVVVAVNRFPTDTQREIDVIRKAAEESGAFAAVPTDHFSRGGEGAEELARAVIAACKEKSSFRFLYELDLPLKEKIETIAREIYSASGVSYSPRAEEQIAMYEDSGFGDLPICMAKTHLSISHDPSLKGAPSGFVLPVREVRLSAGAGFVYPLCGDMRTMPGLSSQPAFMNMDIDENGNIQGLF